MLEAFKKAVLKMFPELSAGLHLDRYARVLAVSDAPTSGGACERFRPRYAVDLEILTPDGRKDEDFPVYEAVPLPISSGCGMEAGHLSFPEPGCLVVVGFAYGRPDHPIVRQIYPLGLSLPDVTLGQMRWQQSAAAFQDVDPDGNWRRVTDNTITDESFYRITRAVEALSEIAREVRGIEENSTEEIGGIKLIKAFGALKLLSGGQANLSATDNLNLTTARDRNLIVAQDRNELAGRDHIAEVKRNRQETVGGDKTTEVDGQRSSTIGADDTVDIAGNRTESVAGTSTESVTATKQITAAVYQVTAPIISIGAPNAGPSLLPLVSNFMAQVIAALNVLAGHTHPSTGACSEGGQVSSASGNIQSCKTDLDSLSG